MPSEQLHKERKPSSNGRQTGVETAAVLLNWNNAELTIRCLDAICPDAVGGQLNIICCDNHSDDDSRTRLKLWAESQASARHWFTLVDTGANVGYAAGNNVGIRLALKDPHVRYVWILNNDALPQRGALAAYLECARRNDRVSIFGATIAEANTILCAGGLYYHPWTTRIKPAYCGHALESAAALPEPAIDYVNGASLFARADVFPDCGLFDERFFLFNEELALCDRVKESGGRIGWCRDAVVEHTGAATTQTTPSVTAYHENLSALLYTRYYRPRAAPLALVLRAAGKVMALLKRREWRSFVPMYRAYRDYVRGRVVNYGLHTDPEILFPGLERFE